MTYFWQDEKTGALHHELVCLEPAPFETALAFAQALSEQRKSNGSSSARDIACPNPSGYQAMSARHSPSAAERLCL